MENTLTSELALMLEDIRIAGIFARIMSIYQYDGEYIEYDEEEIKQRGEWIVTSQMPSSFPR